MKLSDNLAREACLKHRMTARARRHRLMEHRKNLARRETITAWTAIGVAVLATLYFIL